MDDEPGLLNLAKHYLEKNGHFNVDTITSAHSALEQITKVSYDAIVSDYQMPEIDGIAFLIEVRAILGDVPFILFTGKGREDVVIEAINNGADFYLQKGGAPKSQFAELEHKIRKAVDQRRAEKALKGSERRLSDIINFLPDATFAIDLEGTVIAWNRAMEEMTDVSNAAIMGKGAYEYALPFYSERRPLLLDLVLKNDEKIKEHYPFIQYQENKIISQRFIPNLYKGKGAYLWFVASPLYDTKGLITGAIESIRDITEQKNLEQERNAAFEKIAEEEEELRENYTELTKRQRELLKSEERYRNVVEDQTEFISRFLPDGTHVFVNEAYCRYFGKSREEIIGHIFKPRIPKEDRQKLDEHFGSLSPKNPVAMVEHRIIMPDGSECWQRWSERAIFDENGTLLEYQSVGRDVTEMKRADIQLNRSLEELSAAYEQIAAVEEELRSNYNELAENQNLLRKSELQYRNVVEDQTEFISKFLPDGTHVFVNDAYCRYFGKSREEIIGHRFKPVLHPDDREMVAAHIASITSEHPVKDVDQRIIMPDGSIRWQRWSDRAICDPSGAVTEYQSVGRDVTEQKELEEKMENQTRELVQLSSSLARVNKKLNLLFSITRHDINNQLTILKGYLGILEKTELNPSQAEYFRRVTAAADRIAAMIRFTKEYEQIGFNAPVWQECRTLVDTAAKEAPLGQVTVQNDLPTGLEVFADPLIFMVCYNLMDNAVRYGEKITTVRFYVKDCKEDKILVCEDDGKGVAANEKEKIFECGYGNNTGLGLFLSREILYITGITIAETGEPGKGARFEMTVPNGVWR